MAKSEKQWLELERINSELMSVKRELCAIKDLDAMDGDINKKISKGLDKLEEALAALEKIQYGQLGFFERLGDRLVKHIEFWIGAWASAVIIYFVLLCIEFILTCAG